ncbi:MAG: envelope stress response membrane protein PspB [Pontibacterium sp.]
MSGYVFFFVPAVIFFGLVLPLWLVLHYISSWRSARSLSAEDKQSLAIALEEAERLEQRVLTLERILDAEQPNWRQSQHSTESPR